MKKILVIGGGNYQVPLIKRIRELGYCVFCIDKNANAPGFKYSNGYKQIDVIDKASCLSYAKELNIDGVATYGATITLPTVSYIGDILGLNSLPLTTAELAGNKYFIKDRLLHSGCNCKDNLNVYHDIDQVLSSTIYVPCVIKPSDGSGSKGVSIVKEKGQLKSALEYAFSSARFGEVYIEDYIEGEEFSVEAFVHHGTVYVYAIIKTSFYKKCEGNTGISYGHRTPSGISQEKEQAIIDEVVKAVKALNINMGSVNFDVIVCKDNNKPYIIDCGIRIGQNLISSHIIPLSRGINEMDMYIDQVLNLPIDPNPKFQKCIATRLLIAEPGLIASIAPMSEYIGHNGILDIVLRKKEGDIQKIFRDKSDNCGWVVCEGLDPEDAENNAEKARIELLKCISIV